MKSKQTILRGLSFGSVSFCLATEGFVAREEYASDVDRFEFGYELIELG